MNRNRFRDAIAFMLLLLLFTFKICADTDPPATPADFAGNSYEKHIDLVWSANTETDIGGYKIYRRLGSDYLLYSYISKEKNYLSEYYGSIGVAGSYKISAYDLSGNESGMSDSVDVLTREISDDEFLDMVQRATFRYFWNYAHPTSGLARERLGSGNTVTSGGSGFGIMAILVGIHRGFITRQEGLERLAKITNFLIEKADRFHGAYSHWLNGETGKVIPFSQYDDGGDLVETSFLIQGLLAARGFFDREDSEEVLLRENITFIWNTVEWNFYQRASWSNYLYWHWSPNYGWQINMTLAGWNETMIAYILGIASETFHLPARTYYNGFTSSSAYVNGNTYFGHKLYIGKAYGGPLFFSHYSFLGFDPRDKKDKYCNFFLQNRNHTLVNREYCIRNPYGYQGYGPDSWGLTASDNPWGYSAHEPYGQDNGTITPSGGISSIAYTPQESISLIKNLYRTYGNSLWGEYGFKDAFNISQNWFASSYIAIDQGPIIVMIENYRSGLIWEKFMSNPEINAALDSIGFKADTLTFVRPEKLSPDQFRVIGTYPNPFNPSTKISAFAESPGSVSVDVFDLLGRKVKSLFNGNVSSGKLEWEWDGLSESGVKAGSGVFIYRIAIAGRVFTGKMILAK